MSLLGPTGTKPAFSARCPGNAGEQRRPLRWLFWEAGDKRGAGGREPNCFSWDLACPLRGGQGTKGAQERWGVPGGGRGVLPTQSSLQLPGTGNGRERQLQCLGLCTEGLLRWHALQPCAQSPGAPAHRLSAQSAPCSPLLPGDLVLQDHEGWGRFYKSSSDHEDRYRLLCLCLPTPFHFWLNGWTSGWIGRFTDAMKGT